MGIQSLAKTRHSKFAFLHDRGALGAYSHQTSKLVSAHPKFRTVEKERERESERYIYNMYIYIIIYYI